MRDPFSIPTSVKHAADLHGKYKHAWTEESLDISDGRLGSTHTKQFLGTSISTKRGQALGGIMLICFLVLIGRLVQIQLLLGPGYREMAEENRVRPHTIPAERGIIFDAFGRELVHNVPDFHLTMVPRDLPRDPAARAQILESLAAESGLSLPELEDKLRASRLASHESVIIKDNLNYATALSLYIKHTDLPGVAVESGIKRSYLAASSIIKKTTTTTLSLSPILGYLGKLTEAELTNTSLTGYNWADEIGKSGVEKSYEQILRGSPGRKKVEVNAIGKAQTVLAVDPPIPGNNLWLTIDLEAQQYLEQLIKNSARYSGKHRYAAIALNPSTGAILALVSYPAYDNNDFAGGISTAAYQKYLDNPDHPLFNRAIGGLYPPGSTVKLVVSAAALQEGVVNEQTSINSTGGLEVGDRFFKDWKAGGHGLTNITKAIAWSVNTFFYYVGGGYKNFIGLGFDRLYKYYSLFHLADRTGIDLPGEASGFIPTPSWKQAHLGERWFAGDTYNISIGEGDLLVTPLTVARWTAAFANNGRLVTPHVGKKYIDPITKHETNLPFPTQALPGVTPTTLAVVRTGMQDCVLWGSCQLLKTLPFSAGGKTGTAQWNAKFSTHAWFTSFAPLQNPQIVVTVLVEEGGEGAAIALPIARDFLAWWGKKYLQ